ncbi:multidrug efflux SMR transporter, partial [Edwardsiella ictaluri]
MNGYLYLAIAIGAEVIATTALKATHGFSRLGPSLVVVIGYAIAFWGLSQVVKSIPLGVAYAVWSGMGIVLVSLAAYWLYQQALDWAALLGMAMIVGGVLVINLFS